MPHGTSNDATQNVTASLVGREHAVVDHHHRRTRMFGQHAKTEARTMLVITDAIFRAGEAATYIDERREQVGFPHRVDSLHQREDALEPRPRVDGRSGQPRSRAILGLVVLHEDEVPELEESIACRIVQRTTVGPERTAAIDMDFRTWSARSHITHLPEVVLVAEALDALHRNANDVVPDLLGLVVALVHGDPQLVAVESEYLRGQLPTPGNCLFLEVVTETEVAEHLEEHEVTLRATHIVEVVVFAAGPDALLHADCAVVRRGFLSHEIRLERHHPGHGEHDRRIEGNEAGRRHHGVGTVGEESNERLAQVVGRSKVGAGHRDYSKRSSLVESRLLPVAPPIVSETLSLAVMTRSTSPSMNWSTDSFVATWSA